MISALSMALYVNLLDRLAKTMPILRLMRWQILIILLFLLKCQTLKLSTIHPTITDLRIDAKDVHHLKISLWVNVTSTDCILFSFSRITLQTSSPRLHLSTFERWCSKHVRWKVEPGCIRQRLTSSRCTIVVDGSFFPHIPWHISASWYVIADSAIIGSGDFITSSSKDYRSAYAAELCGVLASLQSIDNYLSKINDATMLEISVATYCLGVIRRLERHAQVTTMSTKLHPIVREVLHLNSKRFKSIDFIKLDAHQDELKSFDELSFLEKLNVKCDTRAKELILNTLEDTIVPFPLDLSSPYVMIASNQLTLNYPKDVRIHAHLLKCEIYLKKTLKITDFGTIDWALRSSIIEGVPKHLNLWLSKSLLNFAGTVHQLHRQKLCSSPIYRCCLIEPESDTLHVIDCTHNLFMNFKQILCVNLQQEVLMLTDADITPLLLLESML